MLEARAKAVSSNAHFPRLTIVAVCLVLLTVQGCVVFGYSVFFKHLTEYFGWDRATTSGVYSFFMIVFGGFGIVMGWLVDRFGPSRVILFCGVIAGTGLVLTSQVEALWQIYLTFGVLVGIGLSAGMPVTTGTTTRCFLKHRGLALGIVSSGVGLGTLLVPAVESLILNFGWSKAYLILGVACWLTMIPGSFFLRQKNIARAQNASRLEEPVASFELKAANPGFTRGLPIKTVLRQKNMWLLISIFFLFTFCVQMMMVHLVNYATDLGIPALIAASYVGVIGLASFSGRLLMGIASDKIGSINALLICCLITGPALFLIMAAHQPWAFYLFAILFGFAYGGEIPQIPSLVGKLFGLSALATLIGLVLFCATIGGALGAWLGGKIFDLTQSYTLAFAVTLIASLAAVIITFVLKNTEAPQAKGGING